VHGDSACVDSGVVQRDGSLVIQKLHEFVNGGGCFGVHLHEGIGTFGPLSGIGRGQPLNLALYRATVPFATHRSEAFLKKLGFSAGDLTQNHRRQGYADDTYYGFAESHLVIPVVPTGSLRSILLALGKFPPTSSIELNVPLSEVSHMTQPATAADSLSAIVVIVADVVNANNALVAAL